MATMKPILRRVELNSIVYLLAGLLCGVGLMTAFSLVHPLKREAAAPIIVQTAPGGTEGVVGGRLGGIDSADTVVDDVLRRGLAPGPVSHPSDRGPGAIAQSGDTAAATSEGVIGGRLGGLESADTPNDAAIKQNIALSIQNVRIREDPPLGVANDGAAGTISEQAGQRDLNAADQTSEPDSYPLFGTGHDW